MSALQRVPLIILGAGKVGRALVQQLLDALDLHSQRDGLALRVVAWCDSGGAVVDDDGLGPEALRALIAFKAGGTPLAQTPAGYAQGDLSAIVDVAGSDRSIVVDVTASAQTVPALRLARRRGYGVATANKVPLTGALEQFQALLGANSIGSRARFRYESTVGSAVPVIATLHALLRADDQVRRIQGALSGTLGFVCSGLQAGRPFSLLLAEAMQRGYTEPDPRIDLSGVDVARKALILARTLGWPLELSDVALTPLVPPDYAALPLDEFLRRAAELDAPLAAQAAAAAGQGRSLRYLADLHDGQVSVGLHEVDSASALGQLRGNDNLVAFHTRYYPDEPLVLQGRGAGVDAAASGVHADLIALAS